MGSSVPGRVESGGVLDGGRARLAWGLCCVAIGIRCFVLAAESGSVARDFSHQAFRASGGERLGTGGTAKAGELIQPSGYDIDPLGNVVVGLLFLAYGVYASGGAANKLAARSRHRLPIGAARRRTSSDRAVESPTAPRYALTLLDPGDPRQRLRVVDAVSL